MTERYSDLFELLAVRSDRTEKTDVVLGKALRVWPETELLKPVIYLIEQRPAVSPSRH
jgi:hypothetical protein